MFDVLSLADKKIEKMQKELEELRKEKEQMEENVCILTMKMVVVIVMVW